MTRSVLQTWVYTKVLILSSLLGRHDVPTDTQYCPRRLESCGSVFTFRIYFIQKKRYIWAISQYSLTELADRLCNNNTLRDRQWWSIQYKIYSKSFHQIRRTGKVINPYPTAFPYGNGMVLHFYQQQESSTTKTVHKSLTRDLKLMYSRLTLVRISINL